MADEVRLTISGVAKLQRDLAGLGVEMSDLDLQGLAEGGARLARGFAPKRSGNLARSVRAMKTGKAGNRAAFRVGHKRLPYTKVIEFGWHRRNIRPARFMGRAADIVRGQAPGSIERQVRRLIAGKGLQ